MPKWAVATLTKHENDKRDIKEQAQLDQGTTGDAFWDAAQQQLANTGANMLALLGACGSSMLLARHPAHGSKGQRYARRPLRW